jgi:hypothetical protein
MHDNPSITKWLHYLFLVMLEHLSLKIRKIVELVQRSHTAAPCRVGRISGLGFKIVATITDHGSAENISAKLVELSG